MKQPLDIQKLSVSALKALAYDCLASIQANQKALEMINQEIEKRQHTPEVKTEENTP